MTEQQTREASKAVLEAVKELLERLHLSEDDQLNVGVSILVNAAVNLAHFHGAPGEEIARVLRDAARQIEDGEAAARHAALVGSQGEA